MSDILNAGVCRVCGCTDDRACPGGCYWVEPDLCSRCYYSDVAVPAIEELGSLCVDYFFALIDDGELIGCPVDQVDGDPDARGEPRISKDKVRK